MDEPPPLRAIGWTEPACGNCRALANRPNLILADEPTGELDSTTSAEILQLFRNIVDEEHVTLLVASHDPHGGWLCRSGVEFKRRTNCELGYEIYPNSRD